MSRIDRSVLPLVTGSGVAPLVDGPAAVHVVCDTWRDVLAHLPHRTSRHPQAVPLSFIRGSPMGGTEGRGPSLHVDASASTLRPLSPYGPDRRGLPPFPRFPALRFCCSSGRNGELVPRIGGQGAWQPSLRSGRLRRPARAVRDSSRRRTPCPQCLDVTSWASRCLLVDTSHQQASNRSGGRHAVHFALDAFRSSR